MAIMLTSAIGTYLWIAGSLPLVVLGAIHIIYTFFTEKLSAREPSLNEAMKNSHPALTLQTTMAKAWTGFNASHGLGAIYIGIMNIVLAARYSAVLQHPLVMLLNMATILFYLWLAKKYWFSIPFRGMLLAALCYTTAVIISVSN